MEIDSDIKFSPTCLRMDKRICRYKHNCSFYQPDRDGQPCYVLLKDCEPIQYLVEEAVEAAEGAEEQEISDLEDKIRAEKKQTKEVQKELDKEFFINRELSHEIHVLKEKLRNIKEKMNGE